MATFNHTRVYLNTRLNKITQSTSIYRTPVPIVNESFYFNQESAKTTVYYSRDNSLCHKECSMTSIHLTNKRLILLAQSASIAPTKPSYFDTCEVQLSDFKSLKSKLLLKRGVRFDIKTTRGEMIGIEIKFINKKDANRRESLREYIKMATSAILSSQVPLQGIPLRPQQDVWTHDDLPSYLEAINNGTGSVIAPPAYY